MLMEARCVTPCFVATVFLTSSVVRLLPFLLMLRSVSMGSVYASDSDVSDDNDPWRRMDQPSALSRRALLRLVMFEFL